MIFRFFFGFFAGLLLHKTYRPTHRFGERWGSLMRYAIGGLGLIPVKALILSGMRGRRNDDVVTADLLALLSFGGGTFIGHILDTK